MMKHRLRAPSLVLPGVLAVMAAACAAAVWVAAVHAATPPSSDVAAAAPAVERLDGRLVVGTASPLRRTLRVAAATSQSIELPFTLPATVQADPAKLVKVLSPAAGRIVSLDKHLGDPVRRGDLLCRIDAPDLAQARSDARKAAAALQLAREALARQRSLGSEQIAARRDIEQAENDLAQAASESARADTRLAQLGRAPGGLLEVRSPIDGRVVDAGAAAGGYWNDPTQPLMTVADLSTVFIAAEADERQLPRLFLGQRATVAVDAYPDEMYAATVRDLGDLLDADTRRVRVRLPFANRDGRLRPGMYANAVFFSRPHPGVLVPMAAVVQSGFAARVYVEVQPWRFEPRVVRLGPRVGAQVEIASGLAAGERIVVEDGVLLGD